MLNVLVNFSMLINGGFQQKILENFIMIKLMSSQNGLPVLLLQSELNNDLVKLSWTHLKWGDSEDET